jgi:hypothetical protein
MVSIISPPFKIQFVFITIVLQLVEHDHRYFRSLKDHPQIQIRQIVVVAKHYSVYRGVLATKAFRYIALS